MCRVFISNQTNTCRLFACLACTTGSPLCPLASSTFPKKPLSTTKAYILPPQSVNHWAISSLVAWVPFYNYGCIMDCVMCEVHVTTEQALQQVGRLHWTPFMECYWIVVYYHRTFNPHGSLCMLLLNRFVIFKLLVIWCSHYKVLLYRGDVTYLRFCEELFAEVLPDGDSYAAIPSAIPILSYFFVVVTSPLHFHE